jgi:hypothetical protein
MKTTVDHHFTSFIQLSTPRVIPPTSHPNKHISAATMVNKVIQLRCDCNQYPWGKTGRKSLAATLCEKTPGTNFKLDENTSYAEM